MGIKVETGEKLARGLEIIGGTVASGSGFAGWVSKNHEVIWACGVFAGIFVGVAGLAIGWYYKHKHLKLAERQASQ